MLGDRCTLRYATRLTSHSRIFASTVSTSHDFWHRDHYKRDTSLSHHLRNTLPPHPCATHTPNHRTWQSGVPLCFALREFRRLSRVFCPNALSLSCPAGHSSPAQVCSTLTLWRQRLLAARAFGAKISWHQRLLAPIAFDAMQQA